MSIIIVFAGGDPVPNHVLGDLPVPDRVVAADSGYRNAEALGFDVDVVIGDFDSLPADSDLPPGVERVSYPTDKDATDLELAFEFALGVDAERIVLVGGEGGRFDHELATTMLLGSPRWAGVPEVEWVRSDAHCHVIRNTKRIHGDSGATISLIAIAGDATGVSTLGLQWDLASETLHQGSTRGVSNRFAAPEAMVRVESGALLAVVPRPGQDQSPASTDGSSAS
jgi:thiamine pyrophosphokinase